jgi:hypothetical protein
VCAILFHRTTVVLSLLGKLANPNSKCPSGKFSQAELYPLHYACAVGDFLVVKELISLGSSVTISSADGVSPLMLCISGGISVINFPQEKPSKKSLNEETEIRQSIAEFLLEKGALINNPDKFGQTAIFYSLHNPNLLDFLIKSGANPDIARKDGSTPLIEACRFESEPSIEILINANAILDAQDELGHTALMVSAWLGRFRIVEMLLQSGASINLQDNSGNDALYWASAKVASLNAPTSTVFMQSPDEKEAVVRLLASLLNP